MRVKTLFALIAVLAIAIVPIAVLAQAQDDFAYVPGSNLHGQNGGIGWSGPWSEYSPGSFVITSYGLTFPGLVTVPYATTANYSGTSISYANRNMTSSYGGNNTTTWFEYLIRPEVGYGQSGVMVVGGGFGTPTALQFGLQSDQTGNYLLVQRGNLGTPQRVPYNYQVGQTYLVQGKLEVDNLGQAQITAYVWSTNSGPDASVSSGYGSWTGVSNNIQLYSSGHYTYDYFKVCQNQQDCDPVPEAGTMVALGSFLSMGGLFLRRRFAQS